MDTTTEVVAMKDDVTGEARGDALFVVGPGEPVTDSRQLPAVTPEEEEPFVSGAGLAEHPDDADEVPDDDEELALDADDGEAVADDEPDPTDDELDALVADADDVGVDEVGFDDEDAIAVDGGAGLVGQDEDGA